MGTIKDYGVVANGIADDTAALRRAIPAMLADTGIVQLPRGICRITDTIDFGGEFGGRFQGSGSFGMSFGIAKGGGPRLGFPWAGSAILYDGPVGRPVLRYGGQGAVFDGFEVWGGGKASVGLQIYHVIGVGSGLCRFGSIGFADVGTGLQCGEHDGDGNCGDIRVDFLTAYRCQQAFRVVNAQGVNYSFGHVNATETDTVFDFQRGGNFDCQFVHGIIVDTLLRVAQCGSGNGMYRIGSASFDANQVRLPRLVDHTSWGPARILIDSVKLDPMTAPRPEGHALVNLYGGAACTIRNAAYLRGQVYHVVGGDVPDIPVSLTLENVILSPEGPASPLQASDAAKVSGQRKSGRLDLRVR